MLKVSEFEPLADCLLIDPDPEEQTRESGLVTVSQGPQGAPRWGTVLKVGPGKRIEAMAASSEHARRHGTFPMEISPGDRVLYLHIAGYEVEVEGKKRRIIREHDVLAKDRT